LSNYNAYKEAKLSK